MSNLRNLLLPLAASPLSSLAAPLLAASLLPGPLLVTVLLIASLQTTLQTTSSFFATQARPFQPPSPSASSSTQPAQASPSQTSSHPTTRQPRARFDAIHSHTWIDTLPTPGLNDYHLLSSPSRAASTLRSLGWQIDLQLAPWSRESLTDVDLIVLNLVSADLPPFLVSEIEAIEAFLRDGGGMIVITDHTNCYFHHHVLGALFAKLDITLANETACERVPMKLASGNGWIRIESFSDHPIVQGIRTLGIQTGGITDSRFGIAWTSPQGWGDLGRVPKYGEGQDVGFFGDFQQQPHERVGPLPVLSAKSIDKGRIVLIADQNAVGNMFIGYADNRLMWIQAAYWASSQKRPQADEIQSGFAPDPDRTLIWCFEPISQHKSYWGSTDADRNYHAFGLLSKHADPRATDQAITDAAWMIVPDPSIFDDPSYLKTIEGFLADPKHQMLVLQPNPLATPNTPPNSLEWLQYFEIDQNDQVVEVKEIRSWKTKSGSKIHVLPKSDWENRAIATPYKIRSDEDETRDLQRMEFLWRQGMSRIGSLDAQFNIPKD
jgi:hypothetical protein